MQKNLQHYSFTCCLLSPNLSMIAGTTEINKKIHITSVWSQLHKMSTKTSCGLHLSVHVDWNIYSHTLNAFCLPHDNEQNCCTVLQGKKNWLKWQCETDILTHTQVPHSVRESFVSCLLRKLSWQEKHNPLTSLRSWLTGFQIEKNVAWGNIIVKVIPLK